MRFSRSVSFGRKGRLESRDWAFPYGAGGSPSGHEPRRRFPTQISGPTRGRGGSGEPGEWLLGRPRKEPVEAARRGSSGLPRRHEKL
jgi:hypothetical protein